MVLFRRWKIENHKEAADDIKKMDSYFNMMTLHDQKEAPTLRLQAEGRVATERSERCWRLKAREIRIQLCSEAPHGAKEGSQLLARWAAYGDTEDWTTILKILLHQKRGATVLTKEKSACKPAYSKSFCGMGGHLNKATLPDCYLEGALISCTAAGSTGC